MLYHRATSMPRTALQMCCTPHCVTNCFHVRFGLRFSTGRKLIVVPVGSKHANSRVALRNLHGKVSNQANVQSPQLGALGQASKALKQSSAEQFVRLEDLDQYLRGKLASSPWARYGLLGRYPYMIILAPLAAATMGAVSIYLNWDSHRRDLGESDGPMCVVVVFAHY